jgi:hypothetical protein
MRYLQHIHAAVLNQRQQRFGQVNAERGNGPICAVSIPRTNLPTTDQPVPDVTQRSTESRHPGSVILVPWGSVRYSEC